MLRSFSHCCACTSVDFSVGDGEVAGVAFSVGYGEVFDVASSDWVSAVETVAWSCCWVSEVVQFNI